MKTSQLISIFVLIVSGGAHAETYITDEKCRIADSDFTFSTSFHSVAEDAFSNHKYSAYFTPKGEKSVRLKPESEIDATPMAIGARYTYVSDDNKQRVTLILKHAIEKSSQNASKYTACSPTASVKEYDIQFRTAGKKTVSGKMICDNRTVFKSSKCDRNKHAEG